MRLSDAVSHFGTQQNLAEALGIKQGSISSWDRELIPLARALQVEKITRGVLKADLSLYASPRQQAAQ